MHKWLRENITWSQLLRVQQQRYVRGMYIWLFIVPILAKSLQFISDPIDLIVFNYSLQLSTTLPFSWKMFYFSALCLVAGHVFFFMFCPGLVRDHSSYTHFKNEGKGLEQLFEYTSAIGIDWNQIRVDANIADDPVSDDVIRFQLIFWAAYRRANQYSYLARLSSAFFYSVGMLLIFWVVIENLQTVITLGLKQ